MCGGKGQEGTRPKVPMTSVTEKASFHMKNRNPSSGPRFIETFQRGNTVLTRQTDQVETEYWEERAQCRWIRRKNTEGWGNDRLKNGRFWNWKDRESLPKVIILMRNNARTHPTINHQNRLNSIAVKIVSRVGPSPVETRLELWKYVVQQSLTALKICLTEVLCPHSKQKVSSNSVKFPIECGIEII